MAETITLLELREAAAADLRLFYRSTIQAVNGVVITVDELRDFATDKHRLREGYLWLADGQWRPLDDFDPTTGGCTLNRAFNPQPVATNPVAWYGILEPPAWSSACRDALAETPHRELQEDALVADTYEYAMPTWVYSKDQVVQVRLRYTPSGSPIQEFPINHLKRETANAVTVQIAQLPVDVTNYALVTELKRYFGELSADTDTTTCPAKLAKAICTEKAMERVLHEIGASGKEQLAVDFSIVRQNAAAARKALLNIAAQRDYSLGHTAPLGPAAAYAPDWTG